MGKTLKSGYLFYIWLSLKLKNRGKHQSLSARFCKSAAKPLPPRPSGSLLPIAKGKKKRRDKEREKKEKEGGTPANVSSRHKWRKLVTRVFLIVEVQTIHIQNTPLFFPFHFCILWTLFICAGRCCGLQMLDPAVRLPGHMDLQLFAWTCCASKQTFKRLLRFFFFHSLACCVSSF